MLNIEHVLCNGEKNAIFVSVTRLFCFDFVTRVVFCAVFFLFAMMTVGFMKFRLKGFYFCGFREFESISQNEIGFDSCFGVFFPLLHPRLRSDLKRRKLDGITTFCSLSSKGQREKRPKSSLAFSGVIVQVQGRTSPGKSLSLRPRRFVKGEAKLWERGGTTFLLLFEAFSRLEKGDDPRWGRASERS